MAQITGTEGNDRLKAGVDNDVISGFGGDAGNHRLAGGGDDDRLASSDGHDVADRRSAGVRLIMVFLVTALGSGTHGAEPQMLLAGSWVCATPEAHDRAVAAERQAHNMQALEAELRATCIHMIPERLDDVLAPFVVVIGQEGDKAQVTFMIEVYEQGAGIPAPRGPQPRGGINRQIKYTGWTAATSLSAR